MLPGRGADRKSGIANNDTKAAMLIILKELKKQVEESL